ncbi:MAG TPA: hypothetical protein PLU49_08110, partial [Saprospiraceae bacterium]|nr:hypothetical protein [Saprospiraceae bacterium]
MKSISILIALILPSILLSQSNIKFSLGREYWQHTRLWGLHTGLEFSYPINKKFNVHLGVGYGYGEKNRLYEFPLIKDNFSTLYVGFYPGYEFEYGFERTQTDNAKQFKLFSGVSYDFRISMKQKLSFQSNIFGQKVHHFFVVDKLRDGHEIDYGRVFIGPFDVYIVELNPASAGYAFKNTRF